MLDQPNPVPTPATPAAGDPVADRIESFSPDRRGFLKISGAAGAGLVLGATALGRAGDALAAAPGAPAAKLPAPAAFLRIAPDNTVTVVAKHLEMGQGTHTGLATLVAEELDADWALVKVVAAPADAALYNNLDFGQVQGTGGSSAMHNSYLQYRQVGALGRAMLVEAAAAQWQVKPAEITVAKGVISHKASNRSARFGEFAAAAAARPVPATVTLKDPKRFALIGGRLPRLDTPAKTHGKAIFAIDVTLPGLEVAVVKRAPLFGATVKRVDATAAKAVPGVTDVVQIPSGVAVVAKGFWAAKQGRDALQVEWDDSKAEKRSSAQMLADYTALSTTPGKPAAKRGDAATALAGAAKVVEATFSFPYLVHAPMEPLTCVAKLDASGLELWAGAQLQTIDQVNAAKAVGLEPARVKINTTFAGGSFGRRANGASDYIVEAAAIVKAIGGRAPVKLIWTREDDIAGGRYRPMYVHRVRAGIDARGAIVGWQQTIVGQSIIAGTPFEAFLIKDGIDGTSVEGAADLPYATANLQVELHTTTSPVTVLWWRSVGHTHTGFTTEVMIDELATAAGKDPVAYRLGLLKDHPRHRGVLELAAAKAGWGKPLPKGWARGVAVHESFNSYVAQVVEVSSRPDGGFTVERVVCAVDCGQPINPDVIVAQVEGGIGYGLSSTLAERLTLDAGRVVQSNFHDYTPLRIDGMPKIEVHIVPSTAAPTGIGEPGVPPLAPALANALRALGRPPVRALPLRDA